MICACGNQNAYRWRKTEHGESCNSCAGLGALSVPDVFFDKPYLDTNLVNPNKVEQKDGVWIESKRHKAQVMRELGVREVGDRQHGTRNFDPSLARRSEEQRRK